jgi:putative hydrolase of the HAD superfamily
VKAVFFDAGGTLIHIDHRRVALAVNTVLGHRVEPQAFVAAEYAAREAVERAMADGSGAGDDGARWKIHFRAMLEAVGVRDGEFERVVPHLMEQHRQRHLWSAVPGGTAEALAALTQAGWFVACISNADGTVAELLESCGLLRYLAFVVDSGVVGIEKPDRRIFDLALAQSGVGASAAYYVGDVFAIDVVGARGAGMEPVLLDPLGRYAGRGCRTTPDVPSFCRELVSRTRAA